MNIKLSICMMVKDEENNIKRCLKSVKELIDKKVAELIIVDTGSKDSTIEISKQYTDKVYFHPWNNDFSDMRNKTISYAKGEWIFILDADEELENTEELCNLIKSKNIKNYNTIVLKVRNFNDLINRDVAAINPSPRLFRNDGSMKYVGAVHNQPVYRTPIKSTSIILNHYGYIIKDKKLMDKKFIRTKAILESELKKNPSNIYYQFQLAVTYDMHGDKRLAYKEFQKAYELLKELSNEERKDRVFIYGSYARNASLNGNINNVIELCKEGLELNNEFIDLYYLLAASTRQLGNYKESTKYFKKYLELIDSYENLEISKDASVILYNLDEASIKSAYNNIFLNYFDEGKYEEAKKSIDLIKDNDNKMLYYGKLIEHINIKEEIQDFYNTINYDDKKKFATFIEDIHSVLYEEKSLELRTTFKTIDDEYGLYNKVMCEIFEKEENMRFELMALLEKIDLEDAPEYYINLLYYAFKFELDITTIFSSASEENIDKYIVYCHKKNKDIFELLKNCLKIINVDIDDLNKVRIKKVLSKNLLINAEDKKQLKDTFYDYLKESIEYINHIYIPYIIEDELIYNVKKEDAFLILMNKAIYFKDNDKKKYINYLKKCLTIMPEFKDYIIFLKEEFENEYKVENNELENYKSQVKNTIRGLIEKNSFEEAQGIINEYEQIIKDDLEIVLLKSEIYLRN